MGQHVYRHTYTHTCRLTISCCLNLLVALQARMQTSNDIVSLLYIDPITPEAGRCQPVLNTWELSKG